MNDDLRFRAGTPTKSSKLNTNLHAVSTALFLPENVVFVCKHREPIRNELLVKGNDEIFQLFPFFTCISLMYTYRNDFNTLILISQVT